MKQSPHREYERIVWELTLPERLRLTLKAQADSSVHGRAYVFSGVEGIGAVLAARHFAGLLRTKNQTLRDETFVVSRLRGKQDISVEQIRDLRQFLSYRGFAGQRRVALIEQAENLSIQGMNALLKTLEEPVGNTTIILATENLRALLPTLRSRLWTIPLRTPAPEALSVALTHITAGSAEATVSAAVVSLGRPAHALAFLNDPKLQKEQESLLHWLPSLLQRTPAERLTAVTELLPKQGTVEQATVLTQLLRAWEALIRDAYLLSNGASRDLRFPDFAEQLLHALSPRTGLGSIAKAIRTARAAIRRNAQPRLVLEHVVLSFS